LLAELPILFFGLKAGLLRLSFYGFAFEVRRDRGDVGGVDIDEVVRIYEGFLDFGEGGRAAVDALELTSEPERWKCHGSIGNECSEVQACGRFQERSYA